jgi:hypothetical protein
VSDLWTVYKLEVRDPCINSDVRCCYVGITKQPLHVRLREHLRTRTWPVHPTIVPIETIRGTRKEAERREQYWIWHYTKMGNDLLNIKHIPQDRQAFIQELRASILLSSEAEIA